MQRFWHVPLLAATAAASFVLLRALDPFAGMGTGDLVVFILGAILLFHCFAFAVGFVVGGRSKKAGLVVAVISLLPITFYSVVELRDVIYRRYYAAADRFRENLSPRIPESVRDLHFVPLEESIETHLMFRFTIAPNDLEDIIARNGYRQIAADGFRRPDDLFTHEEYLPLPDAPSFYQATDKYGETGFTLKVSGDRTQVIFRRESGSYYQYRYWESESSRQEEADALKRLKIAQ